MSIITLTTDWISDDHYIGMVKGRIMSESPGVSIVDISHRVPLYSYKYAAFVLRQCFKTFPKGTVHIMGVASERTAGIRHVAIAAKGQFIIGADLGMFHYIVEDEPEEVVELLEVDCKGFPEYHVFAHAASMLANGKKLSELGKKTDQFLRATPQLPTIEQSYISGSVAYIDSYGNAITNISTNDFEKVGKGRNFKITLSSNRHLIETLNTSYIQSKPGELLALFNTANLLEIAIYNGSASHLLNLKIDSSVNVRFFDKPEREELKMGW